MRPTALVLLTVVAGCLEPPVELRRAAVVESGRDAAVDEPPDAGFVFTRCAADADCPAGSVCHPLAKLCALGCETDADCPDSQPRCAALKEAEASAKLCQCATNDGCGGLQAGSVCSTTDHVCEPGCVADSDCAAYFAGRTCDAKARACRL